MGVEALLGCSDVLDVSSVTAPLTGVEVEAADARGWRGVGASLALWRISEG